MARSHLSTLFGILKKLGHLVVEPLRVDDELENFRLSSPETATTTYEGGVGWHKRPPATLECPECTGEMYQHRSDSTIDCPECWREFSYDEFSELDLLYLTCPRCKHRMNHGRRHPNVFDVPQWATCDNCRYHWEFEHSYL